MMLQQWMLPKQQALILEEEEGEQQKIEKEEKKIPAEEMSSADYSRLTSFLEKDESFLTPWSWKPEENKQQSRTDSYFSFNARERWASEKKTTETEAPSTYVVV
ncbi:hypothetical protein OWV82_012211 [Melia azedarach]|uniref:Uncharacterized protein n=1 Tax=Melia azedarach TaxID=155640 RepID=A0ACC1Y0Q6_MELAZ|nr:hypothetical protein OWV82_012211 [Melia azedarach]